MLLSKQVRKSHFRKVHRSLTFLMGVLFATATHIPIIAQPSAMVMGQIPAPEKPTDVEDRQPTQAFDGVLAVFVGHKYSITSAVFSPDGRHILTASSDGTARLWDREGNQLAVFEGHKDSVNSAVFSPDGQQILTASFDKTARLWDREGNQLAVFVGHKYFVKSAMFSPDGQQILTSSHDPSPLTMDNSIDNPPRLWDREGNQLAVFKGHEDSVNSAVFSPDGQQILTASQDGTARLWDKEGNQLNIFEHGYDPVNSAVFSPNGQQILTASREAASLWDRNGSLLAVLNHEYFVDTAEFSSDGQHILTSSSDKTARLWDINGNQLAVLQHDYDIFSAVFSPDSHQILTITEIPHLWHENGNLLAVFQPWGRVRSAVFSPNGQHIFIVSDDGTARLWEVSSAKLVPTQQESVLSIFEKDVSERNAQIAFLPHKAGVRSAVFSSDNRFILTTGVDNYVSINEDKTARLWDRSGNLVAVLEHKAGVNSAVFSPDNQKILTASQDKTARLWDTDGNQLVVLQHENDVRSAEFSSDGQYILINSWDAARLWDTQGNQLAVLEHEDLVQSAEFSPDGQYILTIVLDNETARLWDTQGNQLAVLQHDHDIFSAEFSPDGRHILTTMWGEDKNVHLWDREGNLLAILQHKGSFLRTEFSPDGRYILTASNYRGEIEITRLWDTQGNLLAVLQHEDSVTSEQFSPNSQQILTTSHDGTIRLWDTQGNLLTIFQGNSFLASVKSVVFSPNGQQILTAIDRNVLLWDIQGNLLAILRGHDNKLYNAVFSPNGKQIFSSAGDQAARLWDVSVAIANQAKQLAALQTSEEVVYDYGFRDYDDFIARLGSRESTETVIPELEKNIKSFLEAGKPVRAASISLLIGNLQVQLGEFQKALDYYNQGLSLSRQAGALAEEATILNSLGKLYNDLADLKTAQKLYKEALSLFYKLNDKKGAATILNNIGNIDIALGKPQDALQSYKQALTISRAGAALAQEADALMAISSLYMASKDWETALNGYTQAFFISRHLNDFIKITTIIKQAGRIEAALGREDTAKEYYNQALALSRRLGSQKEEADILYNQAILNRQQNNLSAAKTEIEEAIEIIESLRTRVASKKLRQSYFASVQDYYALGIDILMQLHQQDISQGYDVLAFNYSERARARTLLELLTETNVDIRQGVDPQLLEQERSLQQQLNNLDEKWVELLSSQNTSEAEKNALEQERNTLLAKYEDIQTQIRATSPGYAAITQPKPLTLAEVKQEVLDSDTVLLQYSLGKERSYLWLVTQEEGITSYQLPSQEEIERRAKNLLNFTTQSNPKAFAQAVTPLSKVILDPVKDKLTKKRILIVADGVLQYIPFSALTLPEKQQPLITNYEIINLPSSSSLATIRNETQARKSAPKALAVLADPIFSADDKRLNNGETTLSQQPTSDLGLLALQRSLRSLEDGKFDPLPGTRQEAEAILKLVPEDTQKTSAFGFDANLSTATNPQLSQYRIVHFATHGILNTESPELSGVVLSLVDPKGNSINGFLRLHEIFNLNLPSDLVVISACETGLGKEIKGEGLVGLTRGFMYAGSPRVLVSLWKVDDKATAEIMTRFYRLMLEKKLPPAQALREAQLEMQTETEWKSPYYWAGFVLQGEWK